MGGETKRRGAKKLANDSDARAYVLITEIWAGKKGQLIKVQGTKTGPKEAAGDQRES